ncbi:HAMP domain-containing sensor histidine kinase [Jiangella alkaliphila]|uniref:histidine kinase n=1 Tax=Jiangella alkaliphila TaxID=419479 RepID=A0A1H2KYG7_9ACTN|nr:HAMP domain-containing sensor histidine kinase [Jiangella alkaliphila]SDU73411.1 Signal transduction histidine kinase [Jiangella alkaliphila]
MRHRLLAVLVPLAVLLVGALGVPLGITVAERELQETYVDRLNDAGRFASLAETALSGSRTEALDQELERYHELYGIAGALIATDGAVILGAEEQFAAARGDSDTIIQAALAGARSEPSRDIWPWQDSRLVVAEPVGRDSEVVGVVVTVSDLDRTRERIVTRWAQLAGIGLLPLLALVAVAWPVSSWILRPVRELDTATAGISRGDLTIRVDAGGGPVELRRLAGSFNTMMDAVEHSVERQRAFVADASHQLRNPLTSLRLVVESLRPHLSGDGGRQAHDVAVDELRAMHRMLNALLASARMESMRTAEPVDLDTLLETRVDRWRALTSVEGQSLRVDVTPGLLLLEPPGGLGSILDELISNAMRLSDASVVEVAARPAGPSGLVEVVVRDDGRGIDPADREQALRRFWRAPRHQNVPGTGLGLAICAELVARAGGELRLDDGLPRGDGGNGLAAVVALPVAPEPPTAH